MVLDEKKDEGFDFFLLDRRSVADFVSCFVNGAAVL